MEDDSVTDVCTSSDLHMNVTVEAMHHYIYYPTERIIFSIIMPFIIVFGLMSNIFLLFVIFKMECMRTITNVYLGNLAVADIIFLCTGPLINFVAMQKSPVKADRTSIIGSSFGCAMIRSPNWITYHVSILLITAVTLEKYWAICKPMYYRGINNVLRTFKIVVGIWLSCMVVGFTVSGILSSHFQKFCMNWPHHDEYQDLPTEVAFCNSIFDTRVAVTMFGVISTLTVLIFVIAMVVNIFLYSLIILQLKEKIDAENKQRSDPTDANVNIKRTKRKQQMVRMLLINAIVHFVLLVPSQLLIFLVTVHLGDLLSKEVRNKLNFASEVMVALNSSINPIVYMLLNSQYRRSFYNAANCCKKEGTGYMTVRRPRSTKSTAVDD